MLKSLLQHPEASYDMSLGTWRECSLNICANPPKLIKANHHPGVTWTEYSFHAWEVGGELSCLDKSRLFYLAV